ncbi:MAG: hypothetical protein ACRCZP_19850 [Phycicoccus sp.]
MNIEELQARAHGTAKSKGWWDDVSLGEPAALCTYQLNSIAAKLALVHREVSEALECVRDRQFEYVTGETGKPEGLPTELADIVIRVADLAGALGINLEEAIQRKMDFNATRTHRHGGRAL